MVAHHQADGAYAELRQQILSAGLLNRAYGYYLWRAALSFGLLAAGVALPFAAEPSPPALLLAAAVIAFGSVQVALIGHDAGHLAIFARPRPNDIVGSVCWSLSLGISFWYWRDRHNRHHTHTNDRTADPDLQWAHLVAYSDELATARPDRSAGLMRYQAILGPLYALFLPFAFRFEGWQYTLRRLRGARRAIEVGLLLGSTAGWLLPGALLGWWWVGVFFVSQTLAGLYLALAIAPNHKGQPTWPADADLAFLERQVVGSRNVAPNRVSDFVLGGLNYQIEHHLFPTMPRCHFGAASAIVRACCARQGLPYVEMGALAAYALVIGELRRVGRASAASGPA